MTTRMYQDVIDESGQVLTSGYRDCASRYEVIRDFLSDLRRPFTVLDIGAASGYFSIRLTQEFGARCVAVEPSSDIRHAEGKVAAIVNDIVKPGDVHKLGTFDVVLGLSVLHHMKNWEGMLKTMKRTTRSALIIETPNPRERLKKAVARSDLLYITHDIEEAGLEQIGTATSVWDKKIKRRIYGLRLQGKGVFGRVFSGSGQNGVHLARSQEALEKVLGYRPYAGSLNIETPHAFRLGAYAAEFVDDRGKGGKRGGDYQLWHTRVRGFDGPAHVMRPGQRNHGRNVLEVWAPVNLREHLGLVDGSGVNLSIGA